MLSSQFDDYTFARKLSNKMEKHKAHRVTQTINFLKAEAKAANLLSTFMRIM